MSRLAGSVCLVVFLMTGSTVPAQSLSGIGKFLEPWGMTEIPIARMTPGGRIFWVEAGGSNGCGGPPSRISTIRADGTDYRVVLTEQALASLAQGQYTWPKDLRVSGDGRWLAFRWPHAVVNPCTAVFPWHWFLVDVESGQVSELLHGGEAPTFLSFSDDGTKLAYVGWDPETQKCWWYVANSDGSDPVPVVDTSPWLTTPGMLSPDGTKLLFSALSFVPPWPSDVFVFDLTSGTLTQINPAPSNYIGGISCNSDVSRIVYGGAEGIFALNADGSDFHVVMTEHTGATATVTRDGQYILYYSPTLGTDVRVDWSGGGLQALGGLLGFPSPAHRAVNADGSIVALEVASMTCQACTVSPLGVWYAEPPMLTTSGYGTVGTTLRWDVGGQPGDTFVLGVAPPRGPLVGSVAGQGLGMLDPAGALGFVFTPGLVSTPYNVGSLQQVVPYAFELLGPTEVAFQATVFDGSAEQAPMTTNVTRLTLSPAGTTLATVAPDEGSRGLPARRPPARLFPDWSDLTPDEQLWLMSRSNVQLQAWIRLGVLELEPPQRPLPLY